MKIKMEKHTHLVTFVFEDGTKSAPMKCILKKPKAKKVNQSRE